MDSEKLQVGQTLTLDGVKVLLVEDEYYIADDVRIALGRAGATILGPAATLAQAEEYVRRGGFDYAILDLNLHGESVVPLAIEMSASNFPFAIATGYGSPAVPPELHHITRIEKPFDPKVVVDLLRGWHLVPTP